MSDNSVSMIGTPETKLRRVKDKKAKADVLNLIQNGNLTAEQQLRGYLVIGRTPPPELLSEGNISDALQIADRVLLIPLLSRKLSTVYADEVMDSIRAYLAKFHSAKTDAITAGLNRMAVRWSVGPNKVIIAASTCNRLIAIVDLLTKRLLSRNRDSATRTSKTEKALRSLTRIAVLWGSHLDDLDTILLVLSILASNEDRLGSAFTPQADDAEFDRAVQDLLTSALSRIEQLSESGDAKNVERLADSLHRLPASSQQLKSELEKLQSIRARFPKNIQDLLTKLTEFPETETLAGIEIPADDPDALQVTQLASALVRSWSARDEGPKSNEAFEELRVVLADFFGIEMKGDVGTREPFNPRVHELAPGESSAREVELMRPWVQISNAQTSQIVIKALVVPARQIRR
jgi:hypothetical protein